MTDDADFEGNSPSQVAEELARDERMRREQTKMDAEVFQSLIKHPGWARYMALVETVGQNFHRKIMQPSTDTASVYAMEFAKGALNGLSLAAQLPSSKIKEAADLGLLRD